MHGLAFVLRAEGRNAEAETLYREVLAATPTLGPRHPLVKSSLNGLGAALLSQGKYSEAERALRDLLTVERRAGGPDQQTTLFNIGQFNLAVALQQQGHLAEAEPLYRDALAADRRLRGERHPLVAPDIAGLASVRRARGDARGADTLYREALSIAHETIPKRNVRTASIEVGLGRALIDEGRFAEAERFLRQGTATFDTLAPGSWTAASARTAWGLALLRLGRRADAERILDAGYTAMRRLRSDQDPAVQEAAGWVGELAAGRPADAKTELRRRR
jgi:tetratricopeptide (TPR) repeat protein